MRQDADAFHHLRGAVLHQAIVGGNIGFALSGVDDERFNSVAAALQLNAGWETRAAQSGHPVLVNTLYQRLSAVGAIVCPAVTFDPAVFAVSVNDNAQLG